MPFSSRSSDGSSGFYQFVPVLEELGDFPLCPHCHTPIGMKVWKGPYFHVKLKGEFYGDMCRGVGQQFLVSRRFVEDWRESNLKGLTFSESSVRLPTYHKLQPIYPEYFVAFPVYVLTRLDEQESGLLVDRSVGCQMCGGGQRSRLDRLRIDESTWNGGDIFYPSGLYGVLVVTERFKRFIEEYQLTNFPLTHQDDYNEY